jgi:glycolate oxidase FAD binding subunit
MAGVAGSQRLSMGSARDHLLGFEAVSGQGQSFVGGAKVVKNVTGFDLPKVMAGSWGRLAAVTSLTLRVVPRPEVRTTLALAGLADVQAQTAMALAMGSPAEVAGARALTVFRLQGFAPSVAARFDLLAQRLAQEGKAERLEAARADRIWASLRDLDPLADGRPLWRLSVAPSSGPAAVADVADREARYLYDWAGGLVWLASTAEPDTVRAAAAAAGGHATLVRADPGLRARVPTQHPPTRGVAVLSERVRRAFDPLGVFETGRFRDGPHAD